MLWPFSILNPCPFPPTYGRMFPVMSNGIVDYGILMGDSSV